MLTRYLIKDGIILDPPIRKKWHLLEHLTRHFCRDLPDALCDQIFETVLNREMIVSTGMGGGVALPHARTNLIHKTSLLFARFKSGIEWCSFDGSPVHFLFLIIGPTASAEEYLFVLSKISKMLSRRQNRSRLRKTLSIDEIHRIFSDIPNRETARKR